MRPRRSSRLPVGKKPGSDVSARKHKPDYVLFILTAILLALGLVVVYSISPGLAVQRNVSTNYFVTRQLIAIVIGLGVFAVVSRVPLRVFRSMMYPMLGIALLASLAVLAVGEKVNGAYRWIQIGGLSFQPVEFLKFALIICLAAFLVERIKNRELKSSEKTFKPLLITVGIVGFIVAVLQSDLGSTAVILAVMFVMSFIAGLPMKKIMMFGGIIAAGVVLAIATSGYRRERFLTFMQPERDCATSGYQACQALIAVGSGGFAGQGLNSSGQAFGYLPEAANDSIFAIIAEKFGYIGTVIILGLLLALFARINKVLEHTADMESRLIVAGVFAWLSTQSIINIGAMIGLLPLKGITLPFISYGGTSVIFVCAAIALVFNISRFTDYKVVDDDIAEVHESKYQSRRMSLGYSSGRRR